MTQAPLETNIPNRKPLLPIVATCIAIALGIVIVLINSKSKTSTSLHPIQSNQSLSYSFTKFDDYTLLGESSGAGMKFVIPTGSVEGRDLTASKNQMLFGYNKTIDGHNYTLLYEAASISTSAIISNDIITNINNNILVSDGSKQNSRAKLLSPVRDFVSNNINPKFSVGLGKGRQFTSANLHKDAWLIDFTAHTKQAQVGLSPADLTGQVLMAAGSNRFYYLTIVSISQNWQANITAWSKILNSVKVDQ